MKKYNRSIGLDVASTISFMLQSSPPRQSKEAIERVCSVMCSTFENIKRQPAFSIQIKRIREEAFKMTQEQFSVKTGIPLGTLRRWEQEVNIPAAGPYVLSYFLLLIERELKL